MKPGLVDRPAVQARPREQESRPSALLAGHGESIRVKHTLRPLGVATAGRRDTVDPSKD